MKSARHALCALVFALSCIAPHAIATSYSTDQSDLWYIATESGWGMQLVQRGSVIFATLFVYGPSTAPTWYVATMNPTAAPFEWSGDLYATTGPWFGTSPFDPALVKATPVGTMTWDSQSFEQGTVTYSVNGVVVTKTVVRQTLVIDDYNGTYIGALHGVITGCHDPANDASFTVPVTVNIVQTGQDITISSVAEGDTLTIIGTVTQSGQFGVVQGTFSKTLGPVGTSSLFEINGQRYSWFTRFYLNSTNSGCQETGYFGGVRH